MTLAAGTKLGPYEITAQIGAGGMGEVYRARDPKLGRDVALKVLPDAFARDAERMARFQREAKVLASLNHPNIATIHGLEDSSSTHALVMELVEGPTLAERIRSGAIGIDEALRIAKQITEALEYAHERGIVHRDLKPANVKLTSDGAVKVLDFGLAKAVAGDGSSLDMANSPTISRMATQEGVLLGTAAYMSPEQAKGRPVDRRADIWAFGVVLYEMLTGRRLFEGETVSDTLAAVLRSEPDWSQLPAATPIRFRVLLQRCLQKDAKQRLRDIGDARIAIDEVLAGAPEPSSPGAATSAWRRALPWAFGLFAVAITGAGVWNLKPSPAPARPVTRFTITLPEGQHLAGLDQPALALSADGSELAYVAATPEGAQQIYVRAMDSGYARPIPSTEGATDPFFSPDGQWLGFFVGGKLKKIPVGGGVAQTVAEAGSGPSGATWGEQHTIVYAPILVAPLQQVSDGGGASQIVSRLQGGETGHIWPDFLPGGKAVLFRALLPTELAVQSLETGERRELLPGQAGTMPHYASSGHLIYAQAGSLMAVPFDPRRLETSGAAVQVVQGVLQYSGISTPAQYTVSASGSLAYVMGGVTGTQSRLVWVSRSGAEQPLAAPARYYDQPRLSPDGRRIAVDVVESEGTQQVGLYDLVRDALSRFTFEGSFNQYPTWTPDGKRLAFTSNKEGPMSIFWQLTDGSSGLERLTKESVIVVPFSWSPDGQLMSFIEAGESGPGIHVLRLSDQKVQRFLQTPNATTEDSPQFSPDGRWLAYASEESGRREIYVKPYPGPGGKWQISTEGGTEPMWNRNGRELFYRTGDKMMVVDVSTHDDFVAGKPRQLFEGKYLPNPLLNSRANYDVSLDGQRFLMVKPMETGEMAPTQINVVLNWTEELKRLVPTGK